MFCSTRAYTDTVELNVKGIVELQQAKNNEAIQTFYSGLRLLHANVKSSHDSNAGITGCHCKSLGCHLTHGNEGKQLYSMALPNQDDLAAAHDDFFSLFNRALHLSLDNIPVTGVPLVYCHFLSGILLYNIGLSHHLEALKKGGSKMLSRALDFYTMSHVTLTTEQSCPQLRGRCADLQNFLLMSLVNNMGHIHAYFRNIDEAKICGGELCKRLSPLVCGYDGRPAVSNDDDEYRVFFLNVCFFSESELSSAPAA